ncbi:MAG: hypothetical protein HZB55_01490 [Deltaproteobacteria bacterium]|nr:hypothetical protein [Deltaproteobacteria bacterium]
MKKTLPLTAILFLSLSLFLPSVSNATAPSLVEPTYDLATHTLSVRIRHWSLVNSWHYIKSVEVKVNGALVSTNSYDSQPDTEYTYTYNVAAGPGDGIEVTARCNLWGSRTVGITVPKPAQDVGHGQTSKPADAPKTEPAVTPDK